MENTQLRSAKGYNVDNMIFSKVQIQKIGDTGMTSKRINISTRNDDGTEGELVFITEKLFSFGVSENTDQKTGAVNGYTVPLCLHSKEGPTEDELGFTETFEKLTEKCKDYLMDNKKELKMKDLERTDLRKLNPIYIKKNEDGEVADGATPTLYAKLIVSKKNGQNKIITEFFDSVTGEQFKALDLIGKYCYVRAVIKVESLFLGSKISLQVKLYEAEVNLINTGVKRLLSRPKVNTQVKSLVNSDVSNPMTAELDEVSSIKDDDEDDDIKVEETIKEIEPPKKKKVVVKKTKAKGDE
jgi:hypothetical protein